MENIQILDRKNETEGLTLEEEQLMMNDYNHNFNQVVKEEEIMWWCKNENFDALVLKPARPLTLLNGISCWIS